MNRIIGDRKEKSALDEMEEVARQFNEECNEEERRKREEQERIKKAKEEKPKSERAKAPPHIFPVKAEEPVTDAEMVEGNWASCILKLRKRNLEIATAGQIAELRIKHGRDSAYYQNGGWVAENFNYLPNGDILVASQDYNPHLKYAKEATKAHIASEEFYLDDKIVAELLEAEKKGSVLLLKRKDVSDKISVDSFGKEPLTAFLGWGKDYGKFLNSCEIKEVSLYVADKQKQAFSRALWAYDLYSNSALSGSSSLNGNSGRAFGVRSS
ncbi:MAG: hypothetical protein WC852_02540 [Candidatus Nanoarchaeia archaeon]|jgi:hypothetical protein